MFSAPADSSVCQFVFRDCQPSPDIRLVDQYTRALQDTGLEAPREALEPDNRGF